MIQITVDIPEGSLASLHKDPESLLTIGAAGIAAELRCWQDAQ